MTSIHINEKQQAMTYVMRVIMIHARNIVETIIPSLPFVKEAYQVCYAYKTPYVLFDKSDLAWEDTFLEIEESNSSLAQRPYYAIYPNKSGTSKVLEFHHVLVSF